ncbi:MAG: hypothetical protein NTY51_12165 [Deltaproteobacteria bacterium]|nr:hypothetical protein [Deltaproteobacteria bacterium]
MNKFIGALASFCGEHRLEQKILIGPSLRVGHQWIENVTRDGFSVTNVRVQTLKGFALSIANLRLASTGQKWISETGAWIIVTRLINELIGTGESYFSALFPRDTLARSLSQTIYSLRISGIRPEDLDPGAFESSEKAHDIAWLLNEYLRILDERKLVDYAEVLTLGTQLIQDGGIQQSGIFFALAPEDLDIASLEKKLIESIGPDRFIFLPVDKPTSGAEGDKVSDARILSWIMEPASAPEAQGDGSGKIFQALGFTNEVREAIRQTIAPTEISSTQPRHHLDEVELLYTDQRTYVPIIYDLFSYAALSQDIDTPFELVTFADGIPARLSRPGHALIAWLSWIRNGYPQSSLVNMIQEGWLQSDALSDENTIMNRQRTIRRQTLPKETK